MNEWTPEDDPRVTLPRALDVIAEHVLTHVDATLWDTENQPSEEQRAARRHAILDQHRRLKQLALLSSVENITRQQFDEVKSELSFIAFKPDDLAAIYAAFSELDLREK
jgi:hypothetical protein